MKNRQDIIEALNKLTTEQSECSISVQYDQDEFIDVGGLSIIDCVLVLYAIDSPDDVSLSYNDLKRFLSVEQGNVGEVKLCFPNPYYEQKVTEMVIDDGEFEDILGVEEHPYFSTDEVEQ